MRRRCALSLFVFYFLMSPALADDTSRDPRHLPLKNLNGYFPFQMVKSSDRWNERKEGIRERILVSQGLWPLPTRSELNAVTHGSIERDDYTVERVFFESAPGHFVTGSLYRPKRKQGPLPAILSPHGHWSEGRFYDAGESLVEQEVQSGAEQDEVGGRFPLQARAVQLARMGCIVFLYDMTGNADSIQIAHRPQRWNHLDREKNWGFMSVQADLRMQNMMGLQTWNSIRAVDFLCQLPEVDQSRIGVTGASGGGTQTMILAAIDDRIDASMPCVMVSTAMQGGCTCENAPLLRIDQGNIDIAAAFAPKPMALTAADDWTVELKQKGFPDLVHLYEMLGKPENLTGVFRTEFKHNYNLVNRTAMYHFFNRHFGLGYSEPIVEEYYEPLTKDEATVWSGKYMAPFGDQVGDDHETNLLRLATRDSELQMQKLLQGYTEDDKRFREILGTGWRVIIGRSFSEVGDVSSEVLKDKGGQPSGMRGSGIRELLTRQENQEQVMIEKWSPSKNQKGWIVIATDNGSSDLSSSSDHPASSIKEGLLRSGYGVIALDWLSPKEKVEDGQPMWYQPNGEQGWKRFSGYTYGYNHCLFVKRTHDLQTVVRYAQQTNQGPIHLVGLGSVAGPITLATRSQIDRAVEKTFVDLAGFDFHQVKTHSDPMFVPGSVKYLGADGLVALCSPNHLAHFSSVESPFPVAQHMYAQAEQLNRLRKLEKIEEVLSYLSMD